MNVSILCSPRGEQSDSTGRALLKAHSPPTALIALRRGENGVEGIQQPLKEAWVPHRLNEGLRSDRRVHVNGSRCKARDQGLAPLQLPRVRLGEPVRIVSAIAEICRGLLSCPRRRNIAFNESRLALGDP